jgi:hypothetical protein
MIDFAIEPDLRITAPAGSTAPVSTFCFQRWAVLNINGVGVVNIASLQVGAGEAPIRADIACTRGLGRPIVRRSASKETTDG